MNPPDEEILYRREQDSMGTLEVPVAAYYGSQTQRAVDNFFSSGLKPPAAWIHALALIKYFAAQTNQQLGLLDAKPADAIVTAAREAMAGRWANNRL